MFIDFPPDMANVLAAFLNKKFTDRFLKEGRGYSVREFARELDINERTLARMMDERVELKGIHLEHMQKLARKFGREFLEAMELYYGE